MFNRGLAIVGLAMSLTLGAAGQSQNTAASLFDKGMNSLTGSGLGPNDLNAIDYFRRAAELGYGPAQVVIGYYVENGVITSHGQPVGTMTPREPAEAVEWYKKAAQQGDRLAYWLLGRMYFMGDGVPQDLSAAEPWLQKAASQGDPYGQYLLGEVKLQRSDYAKAAEMFRKAAMQGLPQAQAELGLLLKDGKGVNLDKAEAYLWLIMSYNAGNQSVAETLRALRPQLATTQVEQAQSRSREMDQTMARALVAKGCTGWPGEFAAVPTAPPPDLQSFCR